MAVKFKSHQIGKRPEFFQRYLNDLVKSAHLISLQHKRICTALCNSVIANTQFSARMWACSRKEIMKSKLPREILSLVNRKSHAAGIAYAVQEKKRLLTELRTVKSWRNELARVTKTFKWYRHYLISTWPIIQYRTQLKHSQMQFRKTVFLDRSEQIRMAGWSIGRVYSWQLLIPVPLSAMPIINIHKKAIYIRYWEGKTACG